MSVTVKRVGEITVRSDLDDGLDVGTSYERPPDDGFVFRCPDENFVKVDLGVDGKQRDLVCEDFVVRCHFELMRAELHNGKAVLLRYG